MRYFVPVFLLALVAGVSLCAAGLEDDSKITPLIELQSGALTPGLVLEESPRPIHQVRLVVDAGLERGTLILDGNPPEFDEFGKLVGGIQTPEVRAQGKAALVQEFDCTIELIKEKEGAEKWRLYRIRSPKIRTPLRIASRGSLADSGPARLVVLGPGDKIKGVVPCTRYGLVIP